RRRLTSTPRTRSWPLTPTFSRCTRSRSSSRCRASSSTSATTRPALDLRTTCRTGALRPTPSKVAQLGTKPWAPQHPTAGPTASRDHVCSRRNSMLVFTIRRLIQAIPILFGASLLTFWLMSIPADPVTVEFAGRNPRPPQGTIDAEMHRFRLDESFWAQYWDWIKGIFHGNWGPALDKNANIFHDMMRHFGVTTRLIVLALIVAIVLAVLTGVMSAIKQYSVRDYTFTFLGFVFLSMP